MDLYFFMSDNLEMLAESCFQGTLSPRQPCEVY